MTSLKSRLMQTFLATTAFCALTPAAWATCTPANNTTIRSYLSVYVIGSGGLNSSGGAGCQNSVQAGLVNDVITGGSSATADGATAFGALPSASGNNSTAVGFNAMGLDLNASAYGANATAGAPNSLALGAGATVNAADTNSVALGTDSHTAPAVATTGVTIKGVPYTFAGIAPVGTVSVGDVAAERTVTNVAAGRISATSTDAINGSELFATNQAVEALVTGGAGPVQYSNPATPTIPNGGIVTNSVTMVGASGPVTVSNVAPGQVTATSTQAINGSQLFGLSSSVANNFGGGSHVNSDGSVSAPSYAVGNQTFNNVGSAIGALNSGIANLQSEISGMSNKANAGAAAGIATANLVQAVTPGRSLVTVGAGFWSGQSAVSVGFSHRFSGPWSGWTMKASGAAATSGSGGGGGVGVGYEF